MTLSTLVGLTTCLSNVAVVASLIFLLRQVRQSFKNQQATIRHGRVQQLQLIYERATHADFIDVLIKGMAGDHSLSDQDCNRFVWFVTAIFNMFENMFEQNRDAIIDDETFAQSVAALRLHLGSSGMRAAWMVVRGGYRKEFTDYVDRLMAATPVGEGSEVSSAWRGNLRAAPQAVPTAS